MAVSDARKEEEREKTSAEITWWGLGTQGSFGVGMMPKNDIKRRVPKSPPRHTLLPPFRVACSLVVGCALQAEFHSLVPCQRMFALLLLTHRGHF